MRKAYHFLIILPHFTITYALEVIYVHCICMVEALYNAVLLGFSPQHCHCGVTLVARNEPGGSIYTIEISKFYKSGPLLTSHWARETHLKAMETVLQRDVECLNLSIWSGEETDLRDTSVLE